MASPDNAIMVKMVNKFRTVLRKDKYLLPSLNWAFFTAISAAIALYFMGNVFGFAIPILSALVFGPLYRFSPHTMRFLIDYFNDLGVATHAVMLIVQLAVLIIMFSMGKVRIKIWQTIKEAI